MSRKITLYSTQWCGDCHRARLFLHRHGITYDEIDVDAKESAARQVIEWSGGRRVIPTFEIKNESSGDRVILHNPPLPVLAKTLDIEE
ncbi:MAG: glutaredoxin family protein [Bacteroidota bacterium]|nr:glutaredoxin family protein [Bacteroidota bacterium]